MKFKNILLGWSLEGFIDFSLRAGTATLFIWSWSLVQTHTPKPSEFFFVLALLAGFFYIVKRGFRDLKGVPRGILVILTLFLLSFAVATVYGYFKYDLRYGYFAILSRGALGYSLRLIAGIGLFLLVYIFAARDMRFRKRMFFALALPSAVFFPLLLFPALAARFSLLEPVGGQFIGFTTNSIAAGFLIFIGFVLVFTAFWRHIAEARWRQNIKPILGYGILWIGLELFLLWSHVRSYLLAAAAITVVCPLLMFLYYRRSFLISVFAVFAAILSVVSVYFLAPDNLRKGVADKMGQTFYTVAVWQEVRQQVFSAIDEDKIQDWLQESNDGRLEYAGRPIVYAYYFNFFQKDIFSLLLGLGVNYKEKLYLPIPTVADPAKKQVYTAENVLDVVLYGGLGAAISLFIFALWVIKRVVKQYSREYQDADLFVYALGPALALLGLFIAGLFVTFPMSAPYFWILLALALV